MRLLTLNCINEFKMLGLLSIISFWIKVKYITQSKSLFSIDNQVSLGCRFILLIKLRIRIHIQYFQDISYNSWTIFTFTSFIFLNYFLFIIIFAIIKSLCVIIFCGRRLFITLNWRRVSQLKILYFTNYAQ